MILLLDTSTPIARLILIDGASQSEFEWQADRELAKGLLSWLQNRLEEQGSTWSNLEGIGVFTGPGSFTGLRIGLTVMNTLSDSLKIPIVGVGGDKWQEIAARRLGDGENDRIALPNYGADANITTPKK